jgi:hypothetical protein
MCEFCGEGPECAVCGRGHDPPPAPVATPDTVLGDARRIVADLTARGLSRGQIMMEFAGIVFGNEDCDRRDRG